MKFFTNTLSTLAFKFIDVSVILGWIVDEISKQYKDKAKPVITKYLMTLAERTVLKATTNPDEVIAFQNALESLFASKEAQEVGKTFEKLLVK